MPFYARAGQLPTKRHIQFRRPGGELYAEELISTKGFESIYTLAYHLRPPTATLDVKPWKRPFVRYLPNDPLHNRHYFTGRLREEGDAVEGRVPLVGNDDILISSARVTKPMTYFFRNAGGDELLFVQSGDGTLESPLGEIVYRAHDYLLVPCGIPYRVSPVTPTTRPSATHCSATRPKGRARTLNLAAAVSDTGSVAGTPANTSPLTARTVPPAALWSLITRPSGIGRVSPRGCGS